MDITTRLMMTQHSGILSGEATTITAQPGAVEIESDDGSETVAVRHSIASIDRLIVDLMCARALATAFAPVTEQPASICGAMADALCPVMDLPMHVAGAGAVG